MPVREAIVLAGGLGTRLRSAVPDLPKCMAPVNGRPFVDYLLQHFYTQGINRFLLSVGYKHEVIRSFFDNATLPFDIEYVVEEEPLGTGGGIRLAMTKARDAQVLVLNGDTFFKIDINRFSAFHVASNAECSLALKPMKNFSRYGVVEVDHSGCIQSFREKQPYNEGSINGGIYLLSRDRFLARNLPAKFSLESDYFEKAVHEHCLYAQAQDRYFIDIGIPDDYLKVQQDFLHFDQL